MKWIICVLILIFCGACSGGGNKRPGNGESVPAGDGGKAVQKKTLQADSLRSFFPPEGRVIDIDLDHLEKGPQLPAGEIFKGAECIVSREGNNFNPGMFIKIATGGASLYILDQIMASVIRYDMEGNTICRIGKKGGNISRGEYKAPRDVTADMKHKIIYVLVPAGNRILKYTERGEYQGSIPVLGGNYAGFPPEDVVTTICRDKICDFVGADNQGNILIHYAYWDGNRSPYNYVLASPAGKPIATLKTFRKFDGSTANPYGYKDEVLDYYYKGLLHVKDRSDTLYYVNNGKLIPKYRFITRESLSNNISDKNFCKEAGELEAIFETDNYLIFLYQGKYRGKRSDRFMGYYDKTNGRSYRIGKNFDSDDAESYVFKTEDPAYRLYGFNYFGSEVAYRMYEEKLYRYFIK